MNSPYNGDFRVSQQFKGAAHQGLDLVGIDSKTIHATVAGTVEIAGNNDPNGFGIYVRIKADGTGYRYYYGHMSQTLVKVGDHVVIGQEIGIEGSTGRSTGSHCHYEIRRTLDHGSYLNVSEISGIPNALGTYNDGYVPHEATSSDNNASGANDNGLLVVDVSSHNTVTNWNAVRESGVWGVMIRAGYGRELSQKDAKFEEFYAGARAAGLHVGAYWYSYADSVEDAKREANTCLECIKGKVFDLPVAFDIEDEKTQGGFDKDTRSDMVVAFCDIIAAAGYLPSVYSSLNWFNNYLDYNKVGKYSIWLAQWSSTPTYGHHFDMWQYTDAGSVSGISGRVDMSRCYRDFPVELTNEKPAPPATPATVSITYQVYAGGKWLPNVNDASDYAGVFGDAVTAMYASLSYGDVRYRVHLQDQNRWLPWVTNRNDFAGIAGHPIDMVQMEAPGRRIQYRVHVWRGAWLPWVTDYNDANSNGYAGVHGKPIDAIMCKVL